MKEKNNIEEGFLFDAEEIGKQETDTQTSEGTESTDAPRRRGRKRSMVTEDRPPLTPEQMKELLEGITEIETATGIRYIRIHLTAKMLIGIRESSGKEFTINLGELYQAYQKCLRFTSPEVKRIIFMGHSPARGKGSSSQEAPSVPGKRHWSRTSPWRNQRDDLQQNPS